MYGDDFPVFGTAGIRIGAGQRWGCLLHCGNMESSDRNRIYTERDGGICRPRIDYPVRKLAHMTEYGILCLLACAFVHGYSGNWKVCGISAVAVAALYAATDEIHQLFVPGRAGRFPDVCIDTLGAVIWLLLFTALRKLWEKIAKRRGFQYNKNRKK